MTTQLIRPSDGKLLFRGRVVLWWRAWRRALAGLTALVLLGSLGGLLAAASAGGDDDGRVVRVQGGTTETGVVKSITTPSGAVRQVVEWKARKGTGTGPGQVATVIDDKTFYVPLGGETIFGTRTTTLEGGTVVVTTVTPGANVTLPGETVTLPPETVVVTETVPPVTVVETVTVTQNETVTVFETVTVAPPP
jgi:hypothetical protein